MTLERLCLIGGSGRSGTTILKRIFAEHPDVASVPEWYFAIQPDGLLDVYTTLANTWSPYLFDLKIHRLERLLRAVGTNHPFTALLKRGLAAAFRSRAPKVLPAYAGVNVSTSCPEFPALVDELFDELVDFRYEAHWVGRSPFQTSPMAYGNPNAERLADTLGGFYRRVVQSVAAHQGSKYWVEDNTWNYIWFDGLMKLLPEAKLVHIYRDPRDVVASYTRQSWMPSDPIQSATIYADLMSRWFSVRESLPTGSWLEISLENLVSNPRSVLEKVCRFWGIEWNEALLRTDLSHAHTGRWRTEFSSATMRSLDPILAESMTRLGYLT